VRNTNVISYDDSPKNQLPEDFYIFALLEKKLSKSKSELLRNHY
jgi:hypothetical protein